MKKCHVAKYCKQLKHLLDKVLENSKIIDIERLKLTLDLNNTQIINGWEAEMRNRGLPLFKYYQEWSKINDVQKKKKYTNNEEIADYNFPTIKKSKKTAVCGPAILFPSDSEDEEVTFPTNKNENSKGQKRKKLKKHAVQYDTSNNLNELNVPDVVENFDLSKW